jgi:glutamine cyclotransferase
MRRQLCLPLLAVLALGGCAAASAAAPSPSIGAASPPSPSAAPSPSVAVPSSSQSYPPVEILSYQIVSVRPHDPHSWIEGLALDAQGRLFESKGLAGESELRQVDPLTGAVLHSVPPPAGQYDEGIAVVGDRIIQLTWKEGTAFVWDADTLAPLGTFSYAGEGWGLCFDGTRLVMSDGSASLTFRDPGTFGVQGSVPVTFEGQPVTKINELECVEGSVWANIWETPYIVRIDPGDGRITGVLDGSHLLVPNPALEQSGAWLNGIAHDPATGHWLLTGKLWPSLFEVAIPGT